MESNQELANTYQNQLDSAGLYEEMSPNGDHSQWANNNNRSVDDQGFNLYGEGATGSVSGMRGRYSSPFMRRSADDSLVATDPRMNRIANAEAAMRQEIYKECTFRPNIKDLPNSIYGAKKDLKVPFHTRVTKWHIEREVNLSSKAQILKNSEEMACTFHPKINKNSDKAVKEIRGADFKDDVSTRLYNNSEMSTQQRVHLIEEIKSKKELEELEECTFKPKLITKNAPVHQSVQSKFTLPVAPKPEAPPVDTKNCTFTPKINKIKPTMSSAQLYLSADVVQRLSRPSDKNLNNSGGPADESLVQYFDPQSATNERPILDMASFMGSLNGPNNGNNSNNVSGFNTPGKAGAKKNAPATEGKAKRDAKFNEFLARQQANLKKRADTQKLLERSTTPSFKPQIARRSDTGEKTIEELDFIARNKLEVERRRAQEQEKANSIGDENCTFRPKINTKAQQARSRSIFERSVADHERKLNNRRTLLLEAEQDELVNVTHQPTISKHAKVQGKSVLQLSSDNSQFLDWLKQNNEKKEQKRLEIMREREEKELKQCTFSPETTECPAYVKRIALSMSIVKAARSNTSSLLDPESSKPQWR